MLLTSITDTNVPVHSTEGLVLHALYCDAATLWLEKNKHQVKGA